MKTQNIILALICLGAYSLCSAQQVDTLSRDKSKYAVNKFEDNEIYTVAEPHTVVSVQEPKGKKVKNIIFMIGDGMGLEQLSSAWVLNHGGLNITDNFTKTGLQWTYSENKLITDSAAAGTALATGCKTYNGHISCKSDGTPLETLAETAKNKGKKVGTAVVCRVNDATPATFFAHNTNRDNHEEIVSSMASSGVDVMFGGGIRFWRDRKDGRDIVNEVIEAGYTFVSDREGLMDVDSTPVIGLMADLELPPAPYRGDLHTVAAMKAIELLDNKKGFFLMIEGSCIDDYCHANKTGYSMEELLDLDRTVGAVLEWAAKDGETLVIVTADHATGGMTLLGGELKEGNIKVNFASQGHNGVALPVFAWGPHSEDFVGVYENTGLSDRIRKLIR